MKKSPAATVSMMILISVVQASSVYVSSASGVPIFTDKFDSYVDTNSMLETWSGYGGAEGWLFLTSDYCRSPDKAMEIQYFNLFSPYSEAEVSFSPFQDWDSSEVTSISLFFHGRQNNEPDRMYMTVRDAYGNWADVAYGGDTDDLKTEQWQKWTVDPAQFTGVELSQVESFCIGLGDRNAAPQAGFGYLYIDDIFVPEPVCLLMFTTGFLVIRKSKH